MKCNLKCDVYTNAYVYVCDILLMENRKTDKKGVGRPSVRKPLDITKDVKKIEELVGKKFRTDRNEGLSS